MYPATPTASHAMPGISFIAFVLSVAGWVLFTAWLFTMGAKAGAHAALAVPGLILAGVSIWQPFAHRRRFAGGCDAPSQRNRLFTIVNVGWSLLLLAVGGLLGALVLWAGVLILAIASGALLLIPWSRIPLCRDHFIPACLTTWLGLAVTLGIGYPALAFMRLPVAGWVFWSCAAVLLLWRTEQRWKAERSAKVASVSPP